MPNRLSHATSPYLQQHADNPIDWYPWGSEAFDEAARRDVPILLSVGYAACHWCHVMAHESFEDAETAAQVNAGFVAIKVDREERPDIDAVYMAATQAMTGQGGWPMTCFLTPVGEPFHCGTYYPPTPRQGMPAFRQLLTAVTTAWTEDGDRVRTSAGQIAAQLADGAAAALPPAPVDAGTLDDAAATLGTGFDATHGGFGGAPKFPPSMALEFLVRHHERTGSVDALAQASVTAERMARGGLYDQLAGGFARYSVDARWVVPHFEKMLYDNALLLRVYAHLARLPDADPLFGRVAAETAGFLLADLRTPEGGFAAALDADTDGVEGLTYAWTPVQLREVLGDDDGVWAADLLAVTDSGTFEHGSSTLQLPADPDDPARWARLRTVLLAARSERPQPARDDKVVTAWNGMAIQALAEAGAALGHPEWIDAAAEAAELLLSRHVVDGRVRRSSRAGAVGAAAGVLEDHAVLADALLALHQATGAPRWLDAATGLLDLALQRFSGEEPGAFFDTADDAEELLHRPRELTDNASPCGSSALTSALVTASVLVADGGRYRDAAEAALRSVGTLASKHPRFAGHWLTVAEAVARGPLQVAVAGPDDPGRAALVAHARRIAAGGTVVVAGEPDAAGVPLLADRPLVDGAAAAYVCRGFVCDRPVTTTAELTAALLLRP
ncbi:thioredoxin domain-containing protein [Pseudonocardia abyssalis]|uniref:Thioredoxin domain-containing protein n=1 Tax=Pseudonocardia abyssalis TaxID=2792008 RepID=A0ABS6UXU7_9PSEU|nr:thioredoxin domain-containing protein [Pseudonocardia abyssalis]MBW0118301.1 thioredoxin domain-containing protein [Pseudonocardia abyssalis]MBW0136529.1 thioredoxin domain-containing protein [Pseudonocardia abyssalis]